MSSLKTTSSFDLVHKSTLFYYITLYIFVFTWFKMDLKNLPVKYSYWDMKQANNFLFLSFYRRK